MAFQGRDEDGYKIPLIFPIKTIITEAACDNCARGLNGVAYATLWTDNLSIEGTYCSRECLEEYCLFDEDDEDASDLTEKLELTCFGTC